MQCNLKVLVVIFLTITGCACQKANVSSEKETRSHLIDGEFTINKIDSTNLYYIIYSSKNDNSYQIISKKVNDENALNKIKINEKYFFELNVFFESTNNSPLTGFSSSNPCFFLQENIAICPEEDVLGPFKTNNLQGLSYKK